MKGQVTPPTVMPDASSAVTIPLPWNDVPRVEPEPVVKVFPPGFVATVFATVGVALAAALTEALAAGAYLMLSSEPALQLIATGSPMTKRLTPAMPDGTEQVR